MHLSLARNFAKGIDPGKRAWIPLADASTVPLAVLPPGSKLVIRGIPPTAMGAYPGQGSARNYGLNLFRTSLQMDTYLAEGGFPMSPFSKSASDFSADTSAISGAPPGDARQSGVDASRHALHGDGRAPRGPFPSATARRGGGGGLESFRP